MLIIDKNDDYYDYLSNIYGKDPKVVFDRRGSEIIHSQRRLFDIVYQYEHYPFTYWESDDVNYLFVEIGFFQYLFKFKNIVLIRESGHYMSSPFWQEAIYTYDFELVHIYNNNKHYFEKPMSLIKARIQIPYTWKKKERINYDSLSLKEGIGVNEDNIVKNPILKNTDITKFISPQDIWMQLNNYISSLDNDKDVDIINSDVDKAINHGFDKRWSFRHPIK